MADSPIKVIEQHSRYIPDEIVVDAIDIAEGWDEWKYGKSPSGAAAAAVYAAWKRTKNPPSQKLVADIFDVSEVTIRNRLKEFEQ